METTEYRVHLTTEGRLSSWQIGAATFEDGIRLLVSGLYAAAQVIAEYPRIDGSEEWLSDMCAQWWEDYEKLPNVAKRQTQSRMLVRGVPFPIRINQIVEEEV